MYRLSRLSSLSLRQYLQFITNSFGLKQENTTITTEFLAAFCLFLTIAPTFVIYAFILETVQIPAETGLIAYILTVCIACMLMGLLANLPLAIAPNYALTSLFAYGLIRDGSLSIPHALGIVFVVASLFLLVAISPIRRAFFEALPPILRHAFKAALGAWLFFFGLQMIGVSVSHPSNLLALGNISHPTVIFSAISLFFTFSLWRYRANWSYLIAFSVSLILAFFLNQLPDPVREIEYHKPFEYFLALDLKYVIQAKEYLTAIFLILMITFVESAVILTAQIQSLKEQRLALKESNPDISKQETRSYNRAMITVAAGNMLSALFGAGPVVISMNSLIVTLIGGRTGLVSIFVALLCLLLLPFLPFLPLFSYIPAFAVAALLMASGLLLLIQQTHTVVRDAPFEDRLLFWICLLCVLLVGSLTSGIALTLILYVFLYLGMGKVRKISWGVWLLSLLFMIRFLFL